MLSLPLKEEPEPPTTTDDDGPDDVAPPLSPPALSTPAPMIHILANLPRAPTPASDEIPFVMLSQETQDRGLSETQTETQTTSRPTITLPFWFLLLLFSTTAHGITYNCINKTYPSSSCCSGEITLDPTMTTIAIVNQRSFPRQQERIILVASQGSRVPLGFLSLALPCASCGCPRGEGG
jgi:hypothetical protein